MLCVLGGITTYASKINEMALLYKMIILSHKRQLGKFTSLQLFSLGSYKEMDRYLKLMDQDWQTSSLVN